MKVVVVGAGSVGRYMAEQLAANGHSVTLLDSDERVSARHQRNVANVEWVIGDGCEVATLERVGAATCDVLAAVTGDDEDNLVVSLLAKQEFGVPRVVARVNNPGNHWMFDSMWGVDVSVSTPHLLTSLVEEAVFVGAWVPLMSFDKGRTHLAEVTLDARSPAAGREISALGLPRGSSIVAVVRDGHVITPHPDVVLRAGDEVLVLAGEAAQDELRALLVTAPGETT